MPDNFEKYPINGKMIDDGWSQMKVMLDREMPEEKKKRRLLPLWFWSTGIAASLLLGSFLVIETADSGNTISKIFSGKSLVPEPAAGAEAVPEIQNAIASSNENNLPIASNSTSKTNHFIAKDKHFSNQNANEEKAQTPATEIENENHFSTTINNAASQPDETREVKTVRTYASVSPIPTLDGLSEVENSPHQLLQPLKMPVKAKAPSEIKHGLFVRFNYTGLIDNGYSIGYLVKQQMAEKQHLMGRIYLEKNTRFVHTISQKFDVPKAILDKASLPGHSTAGNSDTSFSLVVYPYRESNALADVAIQNNINGTLSENTDRYVILNALHLGIGASYGFQLTPRIELQAGAGVSYAIQHLEYGFQFGSQSAKYDSSPAFNGNTSANTATNVVNLSGFQSRVFSRFDGYYELGANFSLNRRVQIGAFYRKGLIDISINDPLGKKDRNSFGVMQGIFYF